YRYLVQRREHMDDCGDVCGKGTKDGKHGADPHPAAVPQGALLAATSQLLAEPDVLLHAPGESVPLLITQQEQGASARIVGIIQVSHRRIRVDRVDRLPAARTPSTRVTHSAPCGSQPPRMRA